MVAPIGGLEDDLQGSVELVTSQEATGRGVLDVSGVAEKKTGANRAAGLAGLEGVEDSEDQPAQSSKRGSGEPA